MKLVITIMFLFFLSSCGEKLRLDAEDNGTALKAALKTQYGEKEFTSLSISTKDMFGIVDMAGFSQQNDDGTLHAIDYDFWGEKFYPERTDGIKTGKRGKPLFGEKPAPPNPFAKKRFKISEIDLKLLRAKYHEAVAIIDVGNKYEYIALSRVLFKDKRPKDGILDISFKVRATKPSNRKRYQEFQFIIQKDGTLVKKK